MKVKASFFPGGREEIVSANWEVVSRQAVGTQAIRDLAGVLTKLTAASEP